MISKSSKKLHQYSPKNVNTKSGGNLGVFCFYYPLFIGVFGWQPFWVNSLLKSFQRFWNHHKIQNFFYPSWVLFKENSQDFNNFLKTLKLHKPKNRSKKSFLFLTCLRFKFGIRSASVMPSLSPFMPIPSVFKAILSSYMFLSPPCPVSPLSSMSSPSCFVPFSSLLGALLFLNFTSVSWLLFSFAHLFHCSPRPPCAFLVAFKKLLKESAAHMIDSIFVQIFLRWLFYEKVLRDVKRQ